MAGSLLNVVCHSHNPGSPDRQESLFPNSWDLSKRVHSCATRSRTTDRISAALSIWGNPTAKHAGGNACALSSQDNVENLKVLVPDQLLG